MPTLSPHRVLKPGALWPVLLQASTDTEVPHPTQVALLSTVAQTRPRGLLGGFPVTRSVSQRQPLAQETRRPIATPHTLEPSGSAC